MAGFGQTFNQLVQQQQTPAPAATTGQGMNEDWFSQFGGTTATGGIDQTGKFSPNQGQQVATDFRTAHPEYFNPDGSFKEGPSGGTIQPIPGQGTPAAPGTVITQNPGGNSGSAPGGDPGQAWIQSGGKTVQDWTKFVQQWNGSHGPNDQITIIGSAQGGGTYHGVNYDSVIASHEGGRGAQWLGPGSASGGGSGGGFGGMTFNSPYQNFTAPSLEDARNSPGYQFAQQQGMDAIQHSAAAKGTLLTGGTLKALQSYGTGLADQTYGNVFNRAFQTNQANFNNGLSSDQFNTGTLLNIASMGKPQ